MSASFHAVRCGGLVLGLIVACGESERSDEDNDGEQGGSSSAPGSAGASQGGSSSEAGGSGESQGGSSSETGDGGGSQSGSSTGGGAMGGANAGTGTGASGASAGSGTAGSVSRGGAGSGGGADGGDGGKAATVPPFCKEACSVPADCSNSGVPWNGVDNYACENGACVYTGCNNEAECLALAADYVCRAYPGNPYAGCVKACSVPEDCSMGVSGYDADNYSCDNGGCMYRGCNTDEECDETFPGRVCRRDSTGYGSCWETCSTAADCVLTGAAQDEDNFTCSGGLCTYIGCHNDAECNGSSAVFVCR